MSDQVRVLAVEDNPAQAKQIPRLLEGSPTVHRVLTEAKRARGVFP